MRLRAACTASPRTRSANSGAAAPWRSRSVCASVRNASRAENRAAERELRRFHKRQAAQVELHQDALNVAAECFKVCVKSVGKGDLTPAEKSCMGICTRFKLESQEIMRYKMLNPEALEDEAAKGTATTKST